MLFSSKIKLFTCSILLINTFFCKAQCSNSTPPPQANWFNTANDGNNSTLPPGQQDLHWTWSSNLAGPYAPAEVLNTAPPVFGNYTNSPWPDCDWITEPGAGTTAGFNYYKIEFDLPCNNPCGDSYNTDNTFCLTLQFFADNAVNDIFVNGISQTPNSGGVLPQGGGSGSYAGFKTANGITVSLCNDWQAGHNIMIVQVNSGGGPEALLVQAQYGLPTPNYSVSQFTETTSGLTSDSTSAISPTKTGCSPLALTFNNTSTNSTDYIWNFGDGSAQSTIANPSHTYSNVGNYVVMLIAYSQTNCNFSDTSYLNVSTTNLNINLNSTAPSCYGDCNGKIVATVSGGTPPYDYQWTDASSNPIGTNSSIINSLCAGTYNVSVSEQTGGGTTIIYTEDFDGGAPSWTLNVPVAPEGADPNFFMINDDEGGVAPGGCGIAGNGDPTLHVTSVFNPSGGAAYDAGGLCGILFCPEAPVEQSLE